jgi:glyoxylase-like metal-dependent hydrolase (beta-lactamase superfamily II)
MTGAGNWTWLLSGRVPTLIDAGVGEPGHLDALEKALSGVPLAQVLVTHAHTDHAGGVSAIASVMPHASFRKYPWPERDSRYHVDWRPIDDGERLDAGDTAVVAVHTPGHAPDHLCFWHAESRSVFCGDLALRGSTVWIPAQLQGNMAAYLDSLERVVALEPAVMYPAHGPVIDAPVPLLRSYIEHRLEREAQVVDALRRGDETPRQIVARVYHGLQQIFVPLAEESVVAHLHKLEGEGRARSTEGAWHIIEP